jgi:hypothetical protein
MPTYPNHLSNGDLGDPTYINALVDDLAGHKHTAADTIVGTGGDYTTIQAALTAGAKSLWLKKELFLIDTPIIPPSEDFWILSQGAEVRAHSAMDRMLDLRGLRYCHLNGVFLNGYGLAAKCIDGLNSPSGPRMHELRFSKFWGATDCGIDFTGCEDSSIIGSWFDGRKADDTTNLYGDYGLRIGEAGDGNRTGGQINLYDCKFGYQKKADLYAKNVWDLKIYGSLFASKYTWSTDFIAHAILEGGTGPDWLAPKLLFNGCWFDGGTGAHPNILLQNIESNEITMAGSTVVASDAPNIYSTLNPAVESINIIGGKLERNAGGPHIQCPARNINVICPQYVGGSGIDKTNVTNYFEIKNGGASIDTNYDFSMNSRYLLDPKNYVDATLSGTPKIVEIKIGGVSYYVKVYPTKT